MPHLAQTACTRPEQSKPDRADLPPQWYGTPRNASAVRARYWPRVLCRSPDAADTADPESWRFEPPCCGGGGSPGLLAEAGSCGEGDCCALTGGCIRTVAVAAVTAAARSGVHFNRITSFRGGLRPPRPSRDRLTRRLYLPDRCRSLFPRQSVIFFPIRRCGRVRP